MKKEKVIIDGDWGGDEMQLATVLLAHTEQIEILGATCTFGNVSHDNVYENGKRILQFLNADHVRIFKGAQAPTGRNKPLIGDGAHSVISFLNESPNKNEESIESVDFILNTLTEQSTGTVTIITCGPLTNISQALLRSPDIMKRVKQLVVMGGCTEAMQAYDKYAYIDDVDGKKKRQGNITPYAEFNFQQAAFDAKVVMESNLPIVLLPMNCTHKLTFTIERQRKLLNLFTKEYVRRALVGELYIQKEDINPKDAYQRNLGLMNSPASWDDDKFKIDSVMHDVHCAFYILYPNEYLTQIGKVRVTLHDGPLTSNNMWYSKQGMTSFEHNKDSNLKIATGIIDADKLFDIFVESILKIK